MRPDNWETSVGVDWLQPTGFGTPSDFTAFHILEDTPTLHHVIEAAAAWPGIGWAAEMLANALVGVAAGALVLGGLSLAKRLSGSVSVKH